MGWIAQIVFSAATVMGAPDLAGAWSVSQGRDDYQCEKPDLILDLRVEGPSRLIGSYSGKAIRRPTDDTFSLLETASEAEAQRIDEGRVVRFTTTTRRSGTMRFVSRQLSPDGRPTRMEWQLRDRAGRPFRTLFWMQRCSG